MTSQTLNGTQLALTALQVSDEEAFKQLLSTLLKNSADSAGFEYSDVTADPTDPKYATALVKVNRDEAHVSLWPYQEAQSIRYKRIPVAALGERFGTTIRADLPTTTRELMRIFLTSNGLADRSEQVVDQPVSATGNQTFVVNPGQFLLWGSAPFLIKPKQRQLVDVIKETTLLGFRELGYFSNDPKERLLNQMQADNPLPYPLEPALTSFGAPLKISGYRYDNTQIRATATGDGFYLGEVDLVYTRYDFGWSTNGSQFLVNGPSVPTIQYMVQQVALQTGFPITAADVNAQSFPTIPSGSLETLTITFKEDSLRYTGELTIDYKAN